MNFEQFSELVQNKFTKLQNNGELFTSSVSGEALWQAYISSFKPEEDPVYRDPNSTTHTCNLDKNFIRRYGNVVAITKNLEIVTMWEVDIPESSKYYNSAKAMTELLKSSKIQDVFLETYFELNVKLNYEKTSPNQTNYKLGIPFNHKVYTEEEVEKFGVVEEGVSYRYYHFYANLDTKFVDKSGNSQAFLYGKYRSDKDVFLRGLEEFSLDTLVLVRDLINQGSLLNGTTYLSKIEAFVKYVKEFNLLDSSKKDLYAWKTSYNLPIAKFRNEVIGTLCIDLSQGMELNSACLAWNKKVDPINFMKATAPITKRQIKEAEKFVTDNGYTESFSRRFANIDDIKVSEILHANVGDGKIKTVSLFENVKATSTRHKKAEFDKVEEVHIEKFMKDILPGCTEVELFLESRFGGNLVSLTTSNIPDSKPIFKWDNNYSWTFNGNLAGKSELTKMVEEKGGRTDGAFRFTHSWNELERNQSLMDLHVFMPGCQVPKSGGGPSVSGRRVGWNCRTDPRSGGTQDVDYTSPAPTGYIPVENITFPDISKMPEGIYTCSIHNWSFRSTGGKGKAEIAFNGELYQYIYPTTTNHQWVTIAEVTLKKGTFSIKHIIQPTDEFSTSKDMYGLESNNFQKVNLVCLSPNHWGENNVGNKHYFFMLDKCKSPVSLRSFHSENLLSELATHRKVLEVLGNSTMIEPSEKQLSGLGFNSTVKDEVVLRLKGSHKRVVKVKF